jgi:hypothetical protein
VKHAKLPWLLKGVHGDCPSLTPMTTVWNLDKPMPADLPAAANDTGTAPQAADE